MKRLKTSLAIAAASVILIGVVYIALPASFYTLTALIILISVFFYVRRVLFR